MTAPETEGEWRVRQARAGVDWAPPGCWLVYEPGDVYLVAAARDTFAAAIAALVELAEARERRARVRT